MAGPGEAGLGTLVVSKGQGQGQVKKGHQMKMLHDCHVTHVLRVIWDDGGIHF